MAEFARLADVAMASLRLTNGTANQLPRVGTFVDIGRDRIVAIGPDEWLAISVDDDSTALCGRLAKYGGVVVDVSGNRVRYHLVGPDAQWFLSAGCSYDLDLLVPGTAVSTLLARSQVIIVCAAMDRFFILPRRSFAGYLETWAASVGN